MGDSRKYPYLYHGRLLGFPKGRGGSRLWNSEGMGGNAFWNFQGKVGLKHGSRPWLGMDIFWNCPIQFEVKTNY